MTWGQEQRGHRSGQLSAVCDACLCFLFYFRIKQRPAGRRWRPGCWSAAGTRWPCGPSRTGCCPRSSSAGSQSPPSCCWCTVWICRTCSLSLRGGQKWEAERFKGWIWIHSDDHQFCSVVSGAVSCVKAKCKQAGETFLLHNEQHRLASRWRHCWHWTPHHCWTSRAALLHHPPPLTLTVWLSLMRHQGLVIRALIISQFLNLNGLTDELWWKWENTVSSWYFPSAE